MTTYRSIFHLFLWQRPQSGSKLPPRSRLPGFSSLVLGSSESSGEPSLLLPGVPIGKGEACNKMEKDWGEVQDWHLRKQDWWNCSGSKIYHHEFGRIPGGIYMGNQRCLCCFFTSRWCFLWELSSMSVFPFLLLYLEPCTQHTLGPAGWHFYSFTPFITKASWDSLVTCPVTKNCPGYTSI